MPGLCKHPLVREAGKESIVVIDDILISVFSPNELQLKWGGYLAVASMFPCVPFLILNSLFGHKFPSRPRIILSLVLLIISFIFTSILVKVSKHKELYSCTGQNFSYVLNQVFTVHS